VGKGKVVHINYEKVLAAAVSVSVRAGQKVVSYVEDKSNVGKSSTKSSIGDLVTELDLQLEEEISRQLVELVPGSQVTGEEDGQRGISEIGWVVDPIDGSTNVTHGLAHAAVSIALCVNNRPMLAVVHNPFTKEVFYAVRGSGAYMSRNLTAANGVRLSVSAINALNKSLLSFGMPYDRTKTASILAVARVAFEASQDIRRRGSAALDLVAVAMGQMEAHFEMDLRMWDVAAAGLIIEESGGGLTDWAGRPVNWVSVNEKINILASNGHVHGQMVDVLDGGLKQLRSGLGG
jgi:myo-inositol-1(or 4)-monophosphatase